MPVVRRTLTLGNYAMSAIAILLALFTVWSWVQAMLSWGSPRPYATALMWTLFTLVAFAIVMAIERVQNRGEGR